MNRRTHLLRTLLALALVSAVAAAIAQQAMPASTSQPATQSTPQPASMPQDATGEGRHGGMRERIRQLDANGDGSISRDEAAAMPEFAERFDRLDANGDGVLDPSDRQARKAHARAECFDMADNDKDGKLSRSEFDSMHALCHSKQGLDGGTQPPTTG